MFSDANPEAASDQIGFNYDKLIATTYNRYDKVPAGSGFTFTVYFWLLKGLPVSKLSLFNYATPVIAVTVGSVFLKEPLTWKIVAGAGLVISGVVVAVRSKAG